MSHIGEFELIRRISARFQSPPFSNPEQGEASSGVVGIGDDCAVLPQHDGLDTLVTTDLLIEDRHFLLSDISPEDLGWKSAAVNISDIAAMGGKPTASFLSIALPPCHPERSEGSDSASDGMAEWVDRFISGFRELSSRFCVPLLGGDTSASPDKLFINVTVLGECAHGKAVMRSGASPGDLVCVTGPLGDSAAGLKLILEGSADGPAEEILIRRHYRPLPKVELGMALAAVPGVHAMMDISDGIASDLRHILEASGRRNESGTVEPLGAEIDLLSLPFSPELVKVCAARGWDAAELAVSGGEDYELLFTAAPGTPLPEGCVVIGRITETGGLRWLGSDKDYKGFTHF